jgi:hypothetical protein
MVLLPTATPSDNAGSASWPRTLHVHYLHVVIDFFVEEDSTTQIAPDSETVPAFLLRLLFSVNT